MRLQRGPPIPQRPPSPERPKTAGHIERKALRVRNECCIPQKRRALICCSCFWLLVFVVAAIIGIVVLRPVISRNQDESTAARCALTKHCRVVGDVSEKCAPGYRQEGRTCARNTFYPRVYDGSLIDSSVSACRNVYEHACGAWDEWNSEPTPLFDWSESEAHHTNLLPILVASLEDRDSMLHQFVARECKHAAVPVKVPSRDLEEQWLQIQSQSALPLWHPVLKTHTICLLAMADQLVPDWFYQFSLGYTESKARVISKRIQQAANLIGTCRDTTSASLGMLGDPLTLQIEWENDVVFENHSQIFSLLGSSYGHVWAGAVALAPHTSLSVSSENKLILRVALPENRDEWFEVTHCRRLASVIFFEPLEDRYAATVKRGNPDALLATLSGCTDLSINVTERSSQMRADAWHCVGPQQMEVWYERATAMALCNSDSRLVPRLDVFVPRIVVDLSSIWLTPAMLQPPWSADEMELPSVAARLFWPVFRAIAEKRVTDEVMDNCSKQTLIDRWALALMEKCYSSLMDEKFWVELVQVSCGETCPKRFVGGVQENAIFRQVYKCKK